AIDALRRRAHRHCAARDVDRQRLRRALRDHDLVRTIDDQELAVDAEAEEQRRGAVLDIPLAAIAERQDRKEFAAVAGGPGVAIAVECDVVDPTYLNDWRAAARASLH